MDFMSQQDSNDCKVNCIYSEEYKDFIVEYDVANIAYYSELHPTCVQRVSSSYAVMHIKSEEEESILGEINFSSVPSLFGLLDTSSMEESEVQRLRRIPYLNLYGNGVLVGFIDTGIEYTNPLFKKADNTTRISAIWDQTVECKKPPNGLLYGQEYTEEKINEALKSEHPLEIVPSTDENGHGTFIAGIAAGNEDPVHDFTGVAPQSNLLVVKLKQAKQNLRDFYRLGRDVEAYAENDIMLGIRYLYSKAAELGKPIVICIGVGSNSGTHNGKLPISVFLDEVSTRRGVGIIAAAGNEANLGHHYLWNSSGAVKEEIELYVADDETGFTIELWAPVPDMISIGIISPNREVIRRITAQGGRAQEINFVFDTGKIVINYMPVEYYTGKEVILLHFEKPTTGLWKIEVLDRSHLISSYNMWLPMEHFVSAGTNFLKPDPFITICEPGNAGIPVTVSTYNHKINNISPSSSRGFTRDGNIKPDIAAPGVDVYGPLLGERFGSKTGSSIAAAHVAGAAALLMEWGIVRGFSEEMNTVQIKNLLVKGARRNNTLVYPNREWGYGVLDIYNVFESLRR